ncbi:DUF6585 family protein [Nocardia tengchongensis]|uniref:DUF6585 family protein n=1 Tax=Nocardia tengchongensis TaxID=2055889 RepID=UPI0036AE2ACE
MTHAATIPADVTRAAEGAGLGQLLDIFPRPTPTDFGDGMRAGSLRRARDINANDDPYWIYVYQGGMVWQLLKKSKDAPRERWATRELTPVGWGDITKFKRSRTNTNRRGGFTELEYGFDFRMRDGDLLYLTRHGFDAHYARYSTGFEDFSAFIEPYLIQAHIPAAQTALNRGESIDFGALSVSATGISRRGDTVTWSELAEISITKGELDIYKRGKRLRWASIDCAKIVNLGLLITIARTLATPHGVAFS